MSKPAQKDSTLLRTRRTSAAAFGKRHVRVGIRGSQLGSAGADDNAAVEHDKANENGDKNHGEGHLHCGRGGKEGGGVLQGQRMIKRPQLADHCTTDHTYK